MQLSIEKTITMTSLEIAEYTEKRHDHVLRDIEKMFVELEIIDAPKLGDVYINEQNQRVKIYRLNKELTLTLVSGYNIKLRNTIIKKLEALETIVKQQLPCDFSDPEAAAEAWLKEHRERKAANLLLMDAKNKLIEQDTLLDQATSHLETYLKLMGDGGLVSTTEAAKMLGMRSAMELNKKLRDDGIKYKTRDLPIVKYHDWFKIVPVETRSGHFRNQCFITRTGLDNIGKRYK